MIIRLRDIALDNARRLHRGKVPTIRPAPREPVEILDAKSCPDARLFRLKVDLAEERRVQLRQKAMQRNASRRAFISNFDKIGGEQVVPAAS